MAPKSASAPVKASAKVPTSLNKVTSSNSISKKTLITAAAVTGLAPVSTSVTKKRNLLTKKEQSFPLKPPIQSQNNPGFITNNQNNKITNNKNIKISINQKQNQNTSNKNGIISSTSTIIRDDFKSNTYESNQSASKRVKLTNSTVDDLTEDEGNINSNYTYK